jgi:hypothetical protein
MPEWETRPANQYLPRRVTAEAGGTAVVQSGQGEAP